MTNEWPPFYVISSFSFHGVGSLVCQLELGESHVHPLQNEKLMRLNGPLLVPLQVQVYKVVLGGLLWNPAALHSISHTDHVYS